MDSAVKRFDVVTSGELLIDFVALESGVSLVEARRFEKAAGGAPANVAVGLARLGRSVAFLGQVGQDEFGDFLADTLAVKGVDTGGLHRTGAARTALAFVSLKAGERDFMFYRHPSADMLWRAGDDDLAIAASGLVFHFGSIALIGEPSRASTLRAVQAARHSGSVVSFDPNLRLALWPTEQAARDGISLGLEQADVVKLSREELAFLTRVEDVERGARQIWHDRMTLLTVTDGAHGCWWFTAQEMGHVVGFPVTPVDTTGAGDAFMAGLLSGLLDASVRADASTMARVLLLANAAGALAVTRRGAIPSLASLDEIESFLRRHTASAQ